MNCIIYFVDFLEDYDVRVKILTDSTAFNSPRSNNRSHDLMLSSPANKYIKDILTERADEEPESQESVADSGKTFLTTVNINS